MMKKLLMIACTLTTLSLFGNEGPEKVDYDKLSETLGHLIVRQLVNPSLEFNLDKVIQGMQDERAGKSSPMNEEEYEQTILAIQESLFTQTAEKNLSEAIAFLKLNSAKEGVLALDEQLQYQILKEGIGQEEVKADSIPLIHYKGSLINGTVFSSSFDSGEPISLPLKQTIPGFSRGLVGMKEGEKRVLYVHPELAYGISGKLPPNSLLIFEVEVIKANTQIEGEGVAILDEEEEDRPIS